nr:MULTISPECIES: LuxR C-terminal-related transcriptional regulator [unclassified Mycolicibacterium]
MGAEITSFVGRRQEVEQIKRHLATSRLVTLTGVGGVGKTRLARSVANRLARQFGDGVWFVDLAPLQDEGLLAPTVATVLGLQHRGAGWTVSVLADYLRDRTTLIVLDGCEHLINGCAVLVDSLLRHAPELRIMTTSREALGLTGERVYQVLPLSLPGDNLTVTKATANNYEAVDLFVERAMTVRPTFELTDVTAPVVAAICHRLDGIPLAIELAVSRLNALSLDELLARLQDRFKLLVGGSAAALPRHKTLKELISWSWELCTQEERALWARASVFPSDFSLRSAEDICVGAPLDRESILDVLSGLIAKTILTVHESGGVARYRMLDTLRQFGKAKLTEFGEDIAVRDLHFDYFQRMASTLEETWFGDRQAELLDSFRPEHDNFRVALASAFEDPSRYALGLNMVADLWVFWMATGRANEARRWFDRGLRLIDVSGPEQTRALQTCAYLCLMESDYDNATRMVRQARRAAADATDPDFVARTTQLAGLTAMYDRDLVRAESLLIEAISYHLAAGNAAASLDTAFSLLVVQVARGDLATAENYCREAIKVCDAHGERWSKSYATWVAALISFQRSCIEEARILCQDVLAVGRRLSDPWLTASCLELMAWIDAATGNAWRSACLVGAANEIWRRTGGVLFGIELLVNFHNQCVATCIAQLGEEDFERGLRFRPSLSLDEALALVRGDEAPHHGSSRGQTQSLTPLTPREGQVAVLVARGMTNKEVAEALVISQRTAEAHVERILRRLNFRSRAQVASWVVEQRRTGSDAD